MNNCDVSLGMALSTIFSQYWWLVLLGILALLVIPTMVFSTIKSVIDIVKFAINKRLVVQNKPARQVEIADKENNNIPTWISWVLVLIAITLFIMLFFVVIAVL